MHQLRRRAPSLFCLATLSLFLVPCVRADDRPAHAECAYFGANRSRYVESALRKNRLSTLTDQVTHMRNASARDVTPAAPPNSYPVGSIDSYIFADLAANQITPAPKTTDWEFIRRVTLDLTGRIPAPDRVLAFVADTTPGKPAKLVDELIAKQEWLDKWTMWFGDLYQNASVRTSTGLTRGGTGRNAFEQWISDSLSKNKPYNQMASELINPPAGTNYYQGSVNYLLNGIVTMGAPNQDTIDQMTANVFDTFLGVGHVNCLLCHSGRGHLDAISLWAAGTTRYQAWQLASFFSRSRPASTSGMAWSIQDNGPGFTTDYALNTVSGNRPPRQVPDGCDETQPCGYVAPQYIFNGNMPGSGDNYRAFLAQNVTSDFQFARATVNYLWAAFFGRGIVDPVDGFDPARLDPDNPPPDPWTLQPTNARLLNGLAQHFIDSGYNIKALMREITTSDTYQLSSRYSGDWSPAWEPFFARKFVRRLWGEEVHDAVVQTSGIMNLLDSGGFQPGPAYYAMQFPEPAGLPVNDLAARGLLDSFLRGNRDDQPRRQDGSISQALNLMNNPFIESHLQVTGANPNQLIVKNIGKSDGDLVNTLFLTILSRYPTDAEMKQAVPLPTGNDNRTAAVQDLIWSLYNKVDFVFNY
jgi:hypothetical protein